MLQTSTSGVIIGDPNSFYESFMCLVESCLQIVGDFLLILIMILVCVANHILVADQSRLKEKQ